MPQYIDIIVEGGVVQEVLGYIPRDITVRVIDYDIEGGDPEDTVESPHDKKNRCFLSEYEGSATVRKFKSKKVKK